MFPYVYPSSYDMMSYTPNNGVFPPTYVSFITEPSIRSYMLNEPAVKDRTKEYYYDDIKSNIRGYQLSEPTIPSEFHLYDPETSAGTYPHKVIMGKEEYLDEILSNANKLTKAKVKSDNATAAALDPVRRSYLRSLKKKKLKSFMVRDLIDLSADEKQPDASDDNCQYQSIHTRTELTPPPEPESSCKNYDHYFPEKRKPYKYVPSDNAEKLYQKALRSFSNKYEPSLPDSSKCCDFEESRQEVDYRNLTSSSDTSITCELSARMPTPSSDSQGANSDPCSGGSVTSPCGKAKRIRTIFSCSQLQRLEMEFERTHYMVGSERSQLASELNLTESQVKVWFQNRRIKLRKHFHEQQQAILSKLKNSEEKDSKTEQENDTNENKVLSTTWGEESSS